MTKTEIYYFSGTGNSLHIAKEIQIRIPDTELIGILKHLQHEHTSTDAEVVGIVFPIYLNSVPKKVREFLKKFDPTGVEYIFAIATHGGVANPALSEILIDKILRKNGKKLDTFFDFEMTMNTPTGIVPSIIPGSKKWAVEISEEKIIEKDKKIQDKLEFVSRKIKHNEKDSTSPGNFDRFKELFMSPLSNRKGVEIAFQTDDTCNGCGICEKVCLSGKVQINNGKPHWDKDIDCFYCYACFNFCLQQAILVGKQYTEKKGRFHHPDVTAEEIAAQK